MPSLGQELKQRREERGVSLHQISDITHIGVRFLQAIENDTYDVLPGGIFNRAFVRSFARKVGFDEEQALALYDKQLEEMGGEEPMKNNYLRPEEYEEKPSSNGWLLSLMMLLLLSVATYAAIAFFRGPKNVATNGNGSPTPAPTLVAAASPGAEVSPSPAEVASSPAASPTPEASPSVTPPINGLLVQLTANGSECWVGVRADGLSTQQALLKPGETRDFAATDRVVMNLGNFPALSIKVNGRALNPEKLVPNRRSVVAQNVVITKDNYQSFLD